MEVISGTLVDIDKKDIIDGKLIIGDNVTSINTYSLDLSDYDIEEVIMSNTVTKMDAAVFFGCTSIKRIKMSDSIHEIPPFTFSRCINLEEIILPKNLKIIHTSAFAKCKGLKKIVFPDKPITICELAFQHAGLEEVILPKDTRLSSMAFSNCRELKKVVLPDSLTSIGKLTFCGCANLETIIAKKLREIKDGAFQNSGITDLKFLNGVKYIGNDVFSGCVNLIECELPSSVISLGDRAFYNCVSIENIKLNEGLESIGASAFEHCSSLKTLEIPKSVKSIDGSFISGCAKLEKIKMFSNTGYTSLCAQKLNGIEVTITNSSTGEEKIIKNDKLFLIQSPRVLLADNKFFTLHFFDYDDNWVDIEYNKLKKYNPEYSSSLHIKIYEWLKRNKFMPSMIVIENMPIKDIDNFYINGNYKKWKEIVNLRELEDIDKEDLFCLAYVMGLFNKKGSISQKAYSFLEKEIKKCATTNFHAFFNSLDINKNGYNKDFCDLIYKEYNSYVGDDFLIDIGKDNIFVNIYNNYDVIRKTYPNKKIKTNRRADELTFLMCLDVVMYTHYDDVLLGNEEFAKNIGMYGYSQDVFDNAQRLFEIGKKIPESEIKLFASVDDNKEMVTYELLDKDNPLGVIVGNITNCCQTLTGAANSCVEHGLSERNSKFMIFKMKDKIIGQSWVWYDEDRYRICLDNIEVPLSVLRNELNDETIQQSFLNCLKRMVKGFLKEMERKNIRIDSITIGEGYNQIKFLLKEFERVEDQPKLSDYIGYSDASNQYVLYKSR